MMERQIGHMVRLIDDLLDVARIAAGKIDLKRERVALSSIVAAADICAVSALVSQSLAVCSRCTAAASLRTAPVRIEAVNSS
jgi:K+-sensing histidine kinase KdpD